MTDDKGRVEDVAEKGVKGAEKGLKKGWAAVKDVGKKAEKAIEGEGSNETSAAEQKKCPQCGNMNPKGATKCLACGRPLAV